MSRQLRRVRVGDFERHARCAIISAATWRAGQPERTLDAGLTRSARWDEVLPPYGHGSPPAPPRCRRHPGAGGIPPRRSIMGVGPIISLLVVAGGGGGAAATPP